MRRAGIARRTARPSDRVLRVAALTYGIDHVASDARHHESAHCKGQAGEALPGGTQQRLATIVADYKRLQYKVQVGLACCPYQHSQQACYGLACI